MCSGFSRADRSGSVFYRFVSKLPVYFIYLITASCIKGQAGDDLRRTPYLDSMEEKASVIADVQNTTRAIQFLDSVFYRYGKPTVADKYEYHYFMVDRYSSVGDYVNEERYIDSLFHLLESTGNTEKMASQYAKANILKADRLFEEANYNAAYEYYYKAKNIAEQGSDSCTLGYYNFKIALVLYRDGKYGEAIRYFKTSLLKLHLCESTLAYFYRMQEIYDDIGLSFGHMNMPDSALVYYNKALDHIKGGVSLFGINRLKLFESANGVIYGNMGTVYMQMKQYKLADSFFRKSIEINTKKGYENADAQYTRLKLADLMLTELRKDDARQMIEEINAYKNIDVSTDARLRLYEVTARYYTLDHQPAKAFDYMLKYVSLKDTSAKMSKAMYRPDIDEHVENLRKVGEIDMLERKHVMRNIYLFIAVLICVMSVSIILLVIQNWRRSRKYIRILTDLNVRINDQKNRMQDVLSKLEKSDKEKDRILKAVSHDMRSPVNSALALTDLLLIDEKNISVEQKEYINLIKASCSGALSFTNEILEIATLHSEELQRKEVNIRDIVKKALQLSQARATAKGQQLRLGQVGDVLTAANGEKILRVVNNVVSNAIKFSGQGAVIDISITEDEGGVTIAVKDPGIGIPVNIKNKVFDIFTDAKRFGTEGEEPYGLGLSISKQIIEKHKGKIWFESEEGKGSVFYVYLPKQ